jgi:hypothetical protein
MKRIVDRGAKGQEAPMVITPRALVRLVKQIAGAVRRRRSARRGA